MDDENWKLHLSDFVEASAFYIMADIRGFSVWSRKNQPEVRPLITLLYTCAYECFGFRTERSLNRRVVKFLGDGFFAVAEYDEGRESSFRDRFSGALVAISRFRDMFGNELVQSHLHDRMAIGVGFGIAFGSGFRFHLSGQPLDYIGEKVNLSARLCGAAAAWEIITEYDLEDDIRSICATSLDRRAFGEPTRDVVPLKSYGDTTVCRLPILNTRSSDARR